MPRPKTNPTIKYNPTILINLATERLPEKERQFISFLLNRPRFNNGVVEPHTANASLDLIQKTTGFRQKTIRAVFLSLRENNILLPLDLGMEYPPNIYTSVRWRINPDAFAWKIDHSGLKAAYNNRSQSYAKKNTLLPQRFRAYEQVLGTNPFLLTAPLHNVNIAWVNVLKSIDKLESFEQAYEELISSWSSLYAELNLTSPPSQQRNTFVTQQTLITAVNNLELRKKCPVELSPLLDHCPRIDRSYLFALLAQFFFWSYFQYHHSLPLNKLCVLPTQAPTFSELIFNKTLPHLISLPSTRHRALQYFTSFITGTLAPHFTSDTEPDIYPLVPKPNLLKIPPRYYARLDKTSPYIKNLLPLFLINGVLNIPQRPTPLFQPSILYPNPPEPLDHLIFESLSNNDFPPVFEAGILKGAITEEKTDISEVEMEKSEEGSVLEETYRWGGELYKDSIGKKHSNGLRPALPKGEAELVRTSGGCAPEPRPSVAPPSAAGLFIIFRSSKNNSLNWFNIN